MRKVGPAKFFLLNAVVAFTLSLPKCFEVTEVRQPDTVSVDDVFSIEVDVELTGKDGETLVFGFLAPRQWQAANNTTVRFASTVGNSTMSLMPADELDPENGLPWAAQITSREGIGSNYGEVEWVVFKADKAITPPDNIGPDNPANGTVFIETKAGPSNMITQLGYFFGEAFWGYLNDGNNSISFFADPCIEVTGTSGQPQNLCGPAPRQLVELTTYTFDDVLTITFDAQEDSTDLIGASEVYFCSVANYDGGEVEVCDSGRGTSMQQIGPDLWQLTIWPPDYYGAENFEIAEILCTFRDNNGTIVTDPTGANFQILAKCFR